MFMTTTVTLNGRQIDLSLALPLTVGDWKALKKRGITTEALQQQAKDLDPDVLAAYYFYILHKADSTVTEAEIDGLTFGQLGEIGQVFAALSQEALDRPTLPPSTPSPASTGGASGMSSS
jgi:hypothetical protein